ncbi:hypothetical protein C8R43DRAFT_960593 [Mycena crocata]|nr:hypothetical protein C8R43DRAFT_960593 [Mycena crocata]
MSKRSGNVGVLMLEFELKPGGDSGSRGMGGAGEFIGVHQIPVSIAADACGMQGISGTHDETEGLSGAVFGTDGTAAGELAETSGASYGLKEPFPIALVSAGSCPTRVLLRTSQHAVRYLQGVVHMVDGHWGWTVAQGMDGNSKRRWRLSRDLETHFAAADINLFNDVGASGVGSSLSIAFFLNLSIFNLDLTHSSHRTIPVASSKVSSSLNTSFEETSPTATISPGATPLLFVFVDSTK